MIYSNSYMFQHKGVILRKSLQQRYIIFIQEIPLFINLRDNKRFSGFCQTQQYILFYLDDMFQSIDHHQAIFT
jgi:hypothetical protein